MYSRAAVYVCCTMRLVVSVGVVESPKFQIYRTIGLRPPKPAAP
jgi:hypothetical protein